MKKIIGITFLFAITAIAFISCNDLINSDNETATGNVTVKITDAPFPADFVEAAWITIDRVDLRKAGGECPGIQMKTQAQVGNMGKSKGDSHSNAHAYGNMEFDCDSGFVTISVDTVALNLFELRNGVTEVLANAELPVGGYDMIRLHIVGAEIILNDGAVFPLKIPGGDTSGLKIKLDDPLEVRENEGTELLVDFDLSRSFIVMGNSKSRKGIQGFIFKPVCRAIQESKAGVLKGFVYEEPKLAVPAATVFVVKENDTISSAVTSEGGMYKILGLSAGTYTLSCEKEGYVKQTITDVTISEGKSTTQDILLVKNE
ncbi:MAG: DUF4382 domain-containing protein [Prolixibacteraceae bacterium]|jgi:hypothetical protein|nr:DUF4382 domain-containing protein [Prolixibacteraceae bacterium]